MITKFLAAAILACSTLASAPALAHGGAAPKHGGVVQTASDLSFELVAGEGAAMLYVEDHGKPCLGTPLQALVDVRVAVLARHPDGMAHLEGRHPARMRLFFMCAAWLPAVRGAETP